MIGICTQNTVPEMVRHFCHDCCSLLRFRECEVTIGWWGKGGNSWVLLVIEERKGSKNQKKSETKMQSGCGEAVGGFCRDW